MLLQAFLVLIAYLSAFLNDLLPWYPWVAFCLFDSLHVLMFALAVTTHIIMTFSNSTFNFSHLADTSNYASWVTNVKFVLMNKDLWAVVSDTSFKPVTSLDDVNTLNSKFLFKYIVWSRKNDRACVTIALSCQNGLKSFI